MIFKDIHSIPNKRIKFQILSKINKAKLEKENKYKNKITTRIVNGKIHKFDSKKEAEFYDELFKKLKAGLVKNITLQKSFDLIPTLKHHGKTLRKITYKLDFVYEEDGVKYAVDVKGYSTDVYKIKKRLFIMNYTEYEFVEIGTQEKE